MHISSETDFVDLRKEFLKWRRQFPMFTRDVSQIENIIESHIASYSKHLVNFRQTRKTTFLESAQAEIDAINRLIITVEQIGLMSILSR
jgi:hypothetical protein